MRGLVANLFLVLPTIFIYTNFHTRHLRLILYEVPVLILSYFAFEISYYCDRYNFISDLDAD